MRARDPTRPVPFVMHPRYATSNVSLKSRLLSLAKRSVSSAGSREVRDLIWRSSSWSPAIWPELTALR